MNSRVDLKAEMICFAGLALCKQTFIGKLSWEGEILRDHLILLHFCHHGLKSPGAGEGCKVNLVLSEPAQGS